MHVDLKVLDECPVLWRSTFKRFDRSRPRQCPFPEQFRWECSAGAARQPSSIAKIDACWHCYRDAQSASRWALNLSGLDPVHILRVGRVYRIDDRTEASPCFLCVLDPLTNKPDTCSSLRA